MCVFVALAALAQPVAARLLAEEGGQEELEVEEVLFHYAVVVGIVSLGITFVVGHTLDVHGVHWMPEAAVGVLTGLVAAGLCKASGQTHLLADERFDFEFFMTFLLPPIIFEAGFNLQVTPFVRNLAPTAFFAFIGTFVSTFVVGGLVYLAGQAGLCYPMGGLAALTFGSLISATDPVTVIAVFQKIGVKADLFSMVFGESVLNDAVAIVLSKTLLLFTTEEVSGESVLNAALLFVKIFAGSIAIGIAAGLLSSYVFKKLKLNDGHEHFTMEAALSFVFPWVSYFVAEALELSGLVAILLCGMAMATYTRHNFSHKGAVLTMRAYKAVAAIAETFVFVYLGMAMVAFPILEHISSLNLVALALLACFVGRLHIPVGAFLTNCARKTDGTTLPPISPAYQFIMWWSGLRGGVAFALAAKIYSDNSFPAQCGGGDELAGCAPFLDSGMNDAEAILQTTMLIAAATIFVFGGSITHLALKANVMETDLGDAGTKSDAAIVSEQLEADSQVMLQLDKSGVLLRLLTNERSYRCAEVDARALQHQAFPEEGSTSGGSTRAGIELTSSHRCASAPEATEQSSPSKASQIKGWVAGKLYTTTPPLN